jgi:hypothetical protein
VDPSVYLPEHAPAAKIRVPVPERVAAATEPTKIAITEE